MKFGRRLKIVQERIWYNEKYLKAKINSYNGKINTNFHNNKLTREGSQFICSSVILIDSVFQTGKNYYPQVFLEECKYIVKEKKIPKYIIDDTEISSDSDRQNSDKENSDEEILDEENSETKNSDNLTLKNSSEKNFSEENSIEEKQVYNVNKEILIW